MKDTIAPALREQLTEVKKDCQERWAAFDRYRKENEESLKKGDKDIHEEASRRHSAYAEKAQEAKVIEKQLTEAKRWEDGDVAAGLDDSPIERPSKRIWTPGQRLVESEAYKELLSSGELRRKSAGAGDFRWKAGEVSNREEFKALITGASETSAGAMVENDRLAGLVGLLLRPIVVRDLVTVGDTDSDLVEWVQENVFTNAAAETAEATAVSGTTGTKPESALTFAVVQSNVRTIAHWIPATKRALQDAGQLRTLVDQRLEDGIRLRLDAQMIAGDGAGENLRGILNTSGIQTQDGTGMPAVEAILRAITKIRLAFMEPTAALVHPNDFMAMRLATNANGDYFFGPPNIAGPVTAWGLPLIVSTVIAENTALVGKWNEAMLWVREGVTISASDSHSDFFVRNMVAVLGEGRFAFGVPRPAAFASVTNI